MALSISQSLSSATSKPLRWSPSGFTYLGIKIPNRSIKAQLCSTPSAINDLEKWGSLNFISARSHSPN